MVQRFSVQVDADQFDRLARPTQPVAGITELIWNALDAEADVVTVTIGRNELEGVDVVVVEDDGHGMTHADALRDFRVLGGSWKKGRSTSKTGKRPLHGKEGAGRFRAFAIGGSVEWTTIAADLDGSLAAQESLVPSTPPSSLSTTQNSSAPDRRAPPSPLPGPASMPTGCWVT